VHDRTDGPWLIHRVRADLNSAIGANEQNLSSPFSNSTCSDDECFVKGV